MTDTPSTQTPPVIDATLDQLFTIELTKREFVVIFNVLNREQYNPADARLVIPIIDKIDPICRTDVVAGKPDAKDGKKEN
jgi:hypothetical protein